MQLHLTWDLFVIVFAMVVVAYSFIIGRDGILKVILASYLALPAADAAGSLLGNLLEGSNLYQKILAFAKVGTGDDAVIFIKVFIFVGMVILFAVRGAFEVNTAPDHSKIVRLGVTVIYALLSAGLVISSLLLFVSGVDLIGGGSVNTTTTVLVDIFDGSRLIGLIAENTYLFFAGPAFAFLVHSLFTKNED